MLSGLRRVNGSRYDTTVSIPIVCNNKHGSKDPPLQAGLKPGLYNGQNNGRSNDLRAREPDARVARTRTARGIAVPRHPIRRGDGEFRDTTFRQGGADHRRRYGDRASDHPGVCAGRACPWREDGWKSCER